MAVFAPADKSEMTSAQRWRRRIFSPRACLPLGLLFIGLAFPQAGQLIIETVAEAYLQVSVFVAATLALIYGAERLFNFDLAHFLQTRHKAQVPVAAFLGALPGCGGAIVVVTQYVNGQVGFGALVAVLTATMGDAAFLLLAQEPMTGLFVFALGCLVGTLSGYVLEFIHGRDFMRRQTTRSPEEAEQQLAAIRRRPRSLKVLHPIWLALMVPGVVFAVPIAMQIDPNSWFGPLAGYQPVTLLGFAGGMLCLLMWTMYLATEPGQSHTVANPNDVAGPEPSASSRVINDTNFVTVWVIAAFLVFELGVFFTGADLNAWFAVWAPLTPLIAVLVGFLPGCGPQIIVTSLYLTGALPMAALLGNAISNDGDALFPAIALAPKAAIVATLYTGIPALIVGYVTYWVMV
jgi:hypothetical protein